MRQKPVSDIDCDKKMPMDKKNKVLMFFIPSILAYTHDRRPPEIFLF